MNLRPIPLVFAPASLASAGDDVVALFMVLLPLGMNTPSLRLEGSSTTPHQLEFNIDRDIPGLKPLAF